MIKVQYRGRLGNAMVQLAAGYVLSKKTGLKLDVRCQQRRYILAHHNIPKEIMKYFDLKPSTGDEIHELVELTDKSYFKHLMIPPTTGYFVNGYFQTGALLCDHRELILDLYNSPEDEARPGSNDAFVHARIGDLLNKPNNRNMAYFKPEYLKKLLQTTRSTFNTVYISSDTIDYPPLVELIEKYSLTPYNNDPLATILFARRFNNLILSAGSFSYWMAYLSEAINITVYKNPEQDPLQRQNAWGYNKNVKFIK